MPSARAAALVLVLGFPVPAPAAEIEAGGFAFSDALGGFRLLGVEGEGTAAVPFVVREELLGFGPAVLSIRRLPGRRDWGTLAIHMEKIAVNGTGRPWSGFTAELREVTTRPSSYSDGLSFNQIGRDAGAVTVSGFRKVELRYEPSDRLHFTDGFVDPGAAARFSFLITDPSPRMTFYLLQEAEFPSTGLSPAIVPVWLPAR